MSVSGSRWRPVAPSTNLPVPAPHDGGRLPSQTGHSDREQSRSPASPPPPPPQNSRVRVSLPAAPASPSWSARSSARTATSPASRPAPKTHSQGEARRRPGLPERPRHLRLGRKLPVATPHQRGAGAVALKHIPAAVYRASLIERAVLTSTHPPQGATARRGTPRSAAP